MHETYFFEQELDCRLLYWEEWSIDFNAFFRVECFCNEFLVIAPPSDAI